jgi:hypothetical protein
MSGKYSPATTNGTPVSCGGEEPALSEIDLIDESWVAVPPADLVGPLTADGLWQAWFPRLSRVVFMDRAEKGVRWSVTGELVGSVEVWLEAFRQGTIVHWYVRADAPGGRADRLRERYVRAINEGMFMVKDEAERASSRGGPGGGRYPRWRG